MRFKRAALRGLAFSSRKIEFYIWRVSHVARTLRCASAGSETPSISTVVIFATSGLIQISGWTEAELRRHDGVVRDLLTHVMAALEAAIQGLVFNRQSKPSGWPGHARLWSD